MEIEVPRAFRPLLQPKRYKGAYGGRGGAKSHFFAEQLIARCYAKPTRAVGIREIQLSIRDSVRQLLSDKIQKLGLGHFFEVLDTEIRGLNDSNIIFRGMQAYNAETIKSLEGYDIAWIEEAQTLSARSLELLRPTIRKEGSEIWAGWNPRYRTDPIDVFFRKTPPADAVSVFVNWRDNPWFPETLKRERAHDFSIDPESAEHIWEGGYAVGQGAILARIIEHAERAGRVGDHVDFDPDGPGIEISSDIGFRDTSTWWFWQRRVGGYVVLDYDRDSGLDAGDWIARIGARLNERGWPLGAIWLPHDAANRSFNSRHSAYEQFEKAFRKVFVVGKTSVADRINAARTIARRCEFHKTNCEKGLDGLRAWEYEWNADLQTFSREPMHNWASHDGDGFSSGCQVMEKAPAPKVEEKPKGLTFNALLKGRPREQRI